MDLSSVVVAAPLFTAGAALIVGGVTRWTQRGVARDRIIFEAELEEIKLNEDRFAYALDQMIQAADAANRFGLRAGEIDHKDWRAREPYVLAILDPLGRARVEIAALPEFSGISRVRGVLDMLERFVHPHENAKELLKNWDAVEAGEAIRLLSEARSRHVHDSLIATVSSLRGGGGTWRRTAVNSPAEGAPIISAQRRTLPIRDREGHPGGRGRDTASRDENADDK